MSSERLTGWEEGPLSSLKSMPSFVPVAEAGQLLPTSDPNAGAGGSGGGGGQSFEQHSSGGSRQNIRSLSDGPTGRSGASSSSAASHPDRSGASSSGVFAGRGETLGESSLSSPGDQVPSSWAGFLGVGGSAGQSDEEHRRAAREAAARAAERRLQGKAGGEER